MASRKKSSSSAKAAGPKPDPKPKSRPGRRDALDLASLSDLGVERLAALLLEGAQADPALKRRLQLVLAARRGPAAAAHAIGQRLAALARARGFVDRRRTRGLAAELDEQRRAIVETVAPADPAEGLALMWRFLALADSVHDRCNDSSGVVQPVFHAAVADLATFAAAARPAPQDLAERVWEALQDNDYGQYDRLLSALAPSLGADGLALLRQRAAELASPPVSPVAEAGLRVELTGREGRLLRNLPALLRQRLARDILQQVADLQGDVDTFVAQVDPEARRHPKVAAGLAERLLAAGRAAEALAALEQADRPSGRWPLFEWEDVRIAVLEALGRAAEAQAARWSVFERSLSPHHLRDHLQRLPEFDDVEAEARALAHAARFPDLLGATLFLVGWPAHEQAEATLVRRAAELDGDPRISGAGRREAGRPPSPGRHPAVARHGRVRAQGLTLQPLPPRRPPRAGLRQRRRRGRRLRPLRAARRVARALAAGAPAQDVVLGAGRLSVGREQQAVALEIILFLQK
ncbi:MAG: hypothetical protein U1E23_01685 [Reyranellaceae bacterium]